MWSWVVGPRVPPSAWTREGTLRAFTVLAALKRHVIERRVGWARVELDGRQSYTLEAVEGGTPAG